VLIRSVLIRPVLIRSVLIRPTWRVALLCHGAPPGRQWTVRCDGMRLLRIHRSLVG
jgi:hypothetical protein